MRWGVTCLECCDYAQGVTSYEMGSDVPGVWRLAVTQ